MLVLAAAVALAASPPRTPSPPLVQARATARILSGERIRWKRGPGEHGPWARPATVRIEGVARPAQLVEFQ
jgi:hypothetical protein